MYNPLALGMGGNEAESGTCTKRSDRPCPSVKQCRTSFEVYIVKSPFFSRKVVILLAAVAVLCIAAFVFLLTLSNRIIKAQIEHALGKDAHIERIVLGWNRVEAYGLSVSRNGQPFLKARRIEAKASFLTLFSKRYVVSRLSIEQPVLAIETDEKGDVIDPFEGLKEQKRQGQTSGGIGRPVDLRHVQIDDGRVTVRYRRLKGPDTLDFSVVQLKLDDLAFPLDSRSSKISFKAEAKGPVLSGVIGCEGKIEAAKGTGTLNVQAEKISALAAPEGPRMKARSVRFVASPGGMGQGGIVLSNLNLAGPFLHLETDKAGHVESLLPLKPALAEKKKPLSLTLNKAVVTDGELTYVDRRVGTSHPIRLVDVALSADTLSLPVSNSRTTWQLSARIPGRGVSGRISGNGVTAFKSLDTTAKVLVRDLDIVGLRPYIQKAGEADASAGTLDMDMSLSIRKRSIYAPTHAVIRGLQLSSGKGAGDRFLGIPRAMVVKLLQTSNGEIPLDFVVEGSLDNPSFSLRESFVRRFAVGLGKKLGLSVIETGENVIIESGKALKGIGRGIKGLFR